MRAYLRSAYGPPESLELREVPTPTPTGDEVLVRIRASSVNMCDLDYLYGRPRFARLGTGLRRPKDNALGLDNTSFLYPVWQAAVAVRLSMVLRRIQSF